MIKNIKNFVSKYYYSINKEKIVHTIVNIIFAFIIFIIFYTIAKVIFNKIKNANVKKITKEKKETTVIEIPQPNPEDSKVFSQLHKKFIAEIVFYLLIFIGIIFSLNRVGVNMNSFLVILGTIGFAIAFGLQKFVEEIISGISILVLNYFNIGDLIKVKDTIGYVKNFQLINTTVITVLGEIIIIPNNLITTDLFTNITKFKKIRVRVPAKLSNTNKVNYPKLLEKLKEKVNQSEFITNKNTTSAFILDMAEDAGTTIGVSAEIESVNYFKGLVNIRLIMRQAFEDEKITLLDWSYS
jgi:small conductance mechanosensitive channel